MIGPAGAWRFERTPWQSMTFTGDRLVIVPPPGMIVAEAKLESDGSVSIVAFADFPDEARELTRVPEVRELSIDIDLDEQARFEAECARDLKGEDE